MHGPLVPWCSPVSLEQHKDLQQKTFAAGISPFMSVERFFWAAPGRG